MQEQEIELIDLVRILGKRKKLILLGTLLLTLAAAGVSLLLPRVYEVSAIIEPGKINNPEKNAPSQAIVTPEEIKENILGEAYDNNIRNKLNLSPFEYPKKYKVTVPKETSLVKISIETSAPQLGSMVLNELLNQITAGVNEKVDIEKQKMNNGIRLEEIKNKVLIDQITLTSDQIADITGKIKDLDASRKKALASSRIDAMSVLLYSNEIQNQQIYLNSLQEKLKQMEAEALGADLRVDNLRLAMSQLKAINLVKPPTVSERPVKPKKALIVAMAFMLGLLGTTLLAFMLEYFERAGADRSAREAA